MPDWAIPVLTGTGIGGILLYIVQAAIPRRKDRVDRRNGTMQLVEKTQSLYLQMAERVASLEVEHHTDMKKMYELSDKLEAMEGLMKQQRTDLLTIVSLWNERCTGQIPIDPDRYVCPGC